MDLDTIKKHRESVQTNLNNLESHFAKLQKELEQVGQNIVACRGALMAYDGLMEPAQEAKVDAAV
jgi:chromosome segregation ATPase